MKPFDGYFIATGSKNVMFTLRRYEIKSTGGVTINGVFSGSTYETDYFVETLTGDIETSIKKAFDITGFILPDPNIVTNDRGVGCEVPEYNGDEFTFGKYAGVSAKIIDDVDYMVWFMNEFENSKNIKSVINAIKSNMHYIKHCNDVINEKKKQEAEEKKTTDMIKNECDNSNFVSDIGDRIDFTATIDKIIYGDGAYGCWELTLMTDTNGNKLGYFNSIKLKNVPDFYSEAEEGDVVSFKATIKSHEIKQHFEYGFDFNQTMLSRASKAVLIKSNNVEI